MTKAELIDAMATDAKITKTAAAAALDSFVALQRSDLRTACKLHLFWFLLCPMHGRANGSK